MEVDDAVFFPRNLLIKLWTVGLVSSARKLAWKSELSRSKKRSSCEWHTNPSVLLCAPTDLSLPGRHNKAHLCMFFLLWWGPVTRWYQTLDLMSIKWYATPFIVLYFSVLALLCSSRCLDCIDPPRKVYGFLMHVQFERFFHHLHVMVAVLRINAFTYVWMGRT